MYSCPYTAAPYQSLMHAGTTSSTPSDVTTVRFSKESNMNVASAYEQLLVTNSPVCSDALEPGSVPCVRSGDSVYPVMEAAQYIFSVLIGRYIGILPKEVLLNCIDRIHAYVRLQPQHPPCIHAHSLYLSHCLLCSHMDSALMHIHHTRQPLGAH